MAKSKIDPEYQRKRARVLRQQVVDILGGKCLRCGFDDPRALQVDHIDGGGRQDMLKHGGGGPHYSRVLKSLDAGEDKFQLLCANCNWIKRWENGEHNGK